VATIPRKTVLGKHVEFLRFLYLSRKSGYVRHSDWRVYSYLHIATCMKRGKQNNIAKGINSSSKSGKHLTFYSMACCSLLDKILLRITLKGKYMNYFLYMLILI
jgi:hypothetical protein